MPQTQSKSNNSFVDIDNSRGGEQTEVMKKIQQQNHCPFCPEHLGEYHKPIIVKEGKHWVITPNQWPYKNTKVHYLAIYKKHATQLHELPPEAGAELITLFGQIEQEEHILGGGFAMRFGDTRYSAGTVNHLHAQFIVPDIDKPDFEPVRFKLGKDKGKVQSY